MADQPDNTPLTPDTDPTPAPTPSANQSADNIGGWHEPPVPEGSSKPVVVEAWYKPDDAVAPPADQKVDALTPDETAAPEVIPGDTPERAGAWFTPLDAQLDALFEGADETIAEVHQAYQPPPQPAHASASAPEPAASVPAAAADAGDETQPQAVGDTEPQPVQASTGEPAPAESIPVSADEVATRALGAAGIESVVEVAFSAEDDALTPEPLAEPVADVQATGPKLTPAEQALLAEQQAAPDLPARPAEVTAPPLTGQDVPAEEPAMDPSRFKQVEQAVQVLRERLTSGHLTREQFQAELRRQMILDEEGRWWMLGLETHQWYYYDGSSWIAAKPPGYDEPVAGSPVRTETGMQEVVDAGAGHFDLPPASRQDAAAPGMDDDEIPLPKRVPQEDSEATIVAPSTPFLEPTRASDAPTASKTRQVEVDAGAHIAHPAAEPGLPQRSVTDDAAGFADQTIQSNAFDAQATMPSGALVPQQQQLPQHQDLQGHIVLDAERAVQAPTAKPRIGEFPQPDYRDALGLERNRNFYVKWGIRLTVFTVIGGMALSLIALLAMIGYYLYQVDRYRDAVAELTARAADFQSTVIYNQNGDELAVFSNPNAGLRNEVELGEISPWLIYATIATENETFYTDPGFSILAIVRATVQNLQAGDTVSGASTITQQLARALVLETTFAYERTAERKIIEIIVASEIKRQYSKNEILEIYLNEIFYGNYAYGIEAAAQTYFGKPAAELNPIEAAFLAGLPQSPAGYDPVVNREAALARMYEVLHLMAEATGDGCLEIQHQDQTLWGVAQGQSFCFREEVQPDGSISYSYKMPGGEWTNLFVELAIVNTKIFEPPAVEFTHPHFVNYVWRQLEERYGAQAVYSAGYRVFTTLDESLQQTVEREVADNLAALNAQGYPVNNTAVVVIRPADGAVLAMMGSADYHNDDIKGQVNVAFTAQQPGSTLKPFIYLTAFQPDGANQYMTPATVLWDVNTNFNGYEPVNYDGQFRGPIAVRDALGNSLNIPAVKALEFTGVFRFTELMIRAGVVFPGGNPVEKGAGLPVALGAQDVQLFELTAAYAMLANNGRKVEPYSIIMIEDADQNVIYQATAAQGEQIVDPEYAYLITDILADADARAAEFGYGAPMALAGGRPAAVKTGTSNDSKDVWTFGYTPQLAVGIWVGNTDNEPMYSPRARTPYLTGYFGAAPLWNKIMEAAHATLPIQPFSAPPGVVTNTVCADSGTLPSPGCARTVQEIFAVNAPPPPAEGDIFQTLQVDTFTNTLATPDCMEFAETRTYLLLDDPFAYDWINNTAEGQNWANQRGIDTPVQQPPVDYCDPNLQRPYVAIAFPIENATVNGVLDIRGTIIMQDFYQYVVRYGIGHNPDQFSAPLVTQITPKPETNALLAQIDTTGLANGPYTLRLVVLDRNQRSVIKDVHITIDNAAAPPVLPTPTLAPSPTPP